MTAMLARVLFLSLIGASSSMEAPLPEQWLERIAARHGPGPCKVTLVEEQWRSWRNDGLRRAQWRVHSCQGDETYIVEYWPRDAFPDRADEYEIIPLLPEAAADEPTPNGS
ncbi:MAG: hypothetical protein ACREO3_10775 [Arenimonas sp.]